MLPGIFFGNCSRDQVFSKCEKLESVIVNVFNLQGRYPKYFVQRYILFKDKIGVVSIVLLVLLAHILPIKRVEVIDA